MKKFFFILSSVGLLSACGGGSNNSNPPIVSVDANGNCSAVFLQDYDGITASKKAFAQSSSLADLKSIKSSCDVFRAHHAETVTCNAVNEDEGSRMTANAADEYVYCDSIDRILSGKGDVIPLIPDTGTNCPEQFKNDYNAVMASLNYSIAHPTSSDYSDMKNKCDNFRKRNSRTDKCEAQVVRAGVNYPVHAQGDAVFSACGQVDDLIKKNGNLEAP